MTVSPPTRRKLSNVTTAPFALSVAKKVTVPLVVGVKVKVTSSHSGSSNIRDVGVAAVTVAISG